MSGETEQEWERWLHRTAIKIRQWVTQPDLPDPAYDPDLGWNLDQLAMHFEPALVREHKEYRRQLYNPELRPKRTVSVDDTSKKILVDDFDATAWLKSELVRKIHKRLLEPGLQVTGVPPGELQPKPISRQLLEILRPVIESSELVERGLLTTNVARRFEQVRVFRSEKVASTKRRGAPEKFTYEAEREVMDRKEMRFASLAELMRYLDANLRLIKTGKLPKKPPDRKAMKKAIIRHGLTKFVD